MPAKRGMHLKQIIYSRLLSFATVLIVGLLLLLLVAASVVVSATNSFFSDKIALPPWLLAGCNLRRYVSS